MQESGYSINRIGLSLFDQTKQRQKLQNTHQKTLICITDIEKINREQCRQAPIKRHGVGL